MRFAISGFSTVRNLSMNCTITSHIAESLSSKTVFPATRRPSSTWIFSTTCRPLRMTVVEHSIRSDSSLSKAMSIPKYASGPMSSKARSTQNLTRNSADLGVHSENSRSIGNLSCTCVRSSSSGSLNSSPWSRNTRLWARSVFGSFAYAANSVIVSGWGMGKRRPFLGRGAAPIIPPPACVWLTATGGAGSGSASSSSATSSSSSIESPTRLRVTISDEDWPSKAPFVSRFRLRPSTWICDDTCFRVRFCPVFRKIHSAMISFRPYILPSNTILRRPH
mmetsp:Transcript_9243/g.23718  ORF Transcript_9243/g.23718 Transcript_9243/m.23718 type:complete len:278 (+) Transcript_9243:2704-3537(+)